MKFLVIYSASPNYFGFAPDYISNAASINGDDGIELFLNGTVVDLFGDVNVDGTGEPWEYTDGWAYRNSDTSASDTFNIADWEFSNPNALDGESSNESSATPFPLQTFADSGDDFTPVATRTILTQISSLELSGAEISAFDPITEQLFVVAGEPIMEVVDLSNPANPTFTNTIVNYPN